MVDEITERGGSVSFRDFMELALYHPRHGYYLAARSRYGRHGDFLTAPTASAWYGKVLGGWLGRLRQEVGPLVFVDVASGDGSLIAHVVEEASGSSGSGFAGIVSVERSEAMRSVQEGRFSRLGHAVTLRASIEELGAVNGPVVVHASELFDALPVHRVVMRDKVLHEFTVAAQAGSLVWHENRASENLRRYFEGHGVKLEEGQVAEVNLEARGLHGRILDACGAEGLALVLDYGYPAPRLYDPRGRRGGSLAAFRGHRLQRDLLLDPGEQDLTAHVNWDDLQRAAEGRGWQRIGLFPLAEFLVRVGLAGAMERAGLGMEAELDARTVIERQEIKRLLDPEGMGSDLKVLIQGRGLLAETAEKHLLSDV